MPRDRRPTTVQVHQEADADAAGPISLPISFFSAGGIAPEWDAADRDTFLRTFWRDFGNDMLSAVLATSVAKIQTQNWEIEGPEAVAQTYQRILRDEANFYKGWGDMVARGVTDYYTQDNGWFMERRRSGAKDYTGPMLGVAHLDSARMRPTGNADYPYIYSDIQGADHLMHRSQFIRIVDMPTPVTTYKGADKGFCALSRALSTAIILTLLVTMKREKLSDLPPSAIAVFNNINRNQFETALKLYSAQEDMKSNLVWRQLMPLFGIDPAHPAGIQFVSLREVWEGYDDMTAMNIAAYSFAAAWRIDPREFWPVSQGPLGTGKEAEVQHQKAKSKSTGLLFTEIERAFNSGTSLPDSSSFRFALQDAEEEQQRAYIHGLQVGNVKAMQEAGAGLTAEEIRYMLAVQYRILPRTMLEVPEEGAQPAVSDIFLDDVERQSKEFGGWWMGPMVRIDSQGQKVYLNKKEKRLYALPAPSWIGEKDTRKRADAERASEVLPGTEAVKDLTFGSRAVLEATIVDRMVCCESHAAGLWQPVLVDMCALNYLTDDKAAIASMAPQDWIYDVTQAIVPLALTGGDVLTALAYEIERRLPPEGFALDDKAGKGLETINQKIAALPGPIARQVRETAGQILTTMSSSRKRRLGLLKDIPDAVWNDAVAQDELEAQPEIGKA